MDIPVEGNVSSSILDPLLFDIFINDMYMFMEGCTLYNCVDGNSLSCTAQTIDAVILNIQLNGCKVFKWFTDYEIQANSKIFQFMLVSPDGDCNS